LGLGQIPVENQVLLQVWSEKTGASAEDLDAVLKLQENNTILLKKACSAGCLNGFFSEELEIKH
jgi:hypothetical protein